MNEAHLQTSAASQQTRRHPDGADLFPPLFRRRRLPLRRAPVGTAHGVHHRHQGQHHLRAEGRGGAGGLVDDGHQYRGLEVPARAAGHAGAGNRRAAAGGARGGDHPRLGPGRRLLCHPRGCGHLPRRAGPHAADAEGGLQLAGMVQRGLRPPGAGCGGAELALGSLDRRRDLRGHRLPQSAVLGLLHQLR